MEVFSWRNVLYALLAGIILCIGFFIAARFHFYAIDHSMNASKYKRMYENNKVQEEILLLSLENTTISLEIENLAKKEGIGVEYLQLKNKQKELNKYLEAVKTNSASYILEAENSQKMSEDFDNYGKVSVSFSTIFGVFIGIFLYFVSHKEKIILLKGNNFFRIFQITKIFFSKRNQKEVFEPILADWQEEYFEALFKKEAWKARWINVRYTYAFLVAMWLKSPIGDLIEFVVKIAKG